VVSRGVTWCHVVSRGGVTLSGTGPRGWHVVSRDVSRDVSRGDTW
jgi:hypothetical protein